jgi:hypothetical protein
MRVLHVRVACLADARPLEEIAALLEDAGLDVEETERHDEALGELLDRVEARLRPLGFGLELLAAARRALERGALGYGVVVARRRDAGSATPTETAASQASATK